MGAPHCGPHFISSEQLSQLLSADFHPALRPPAPCGCPQAQSAPVSLLQATTCSRPSPTLRCSCEGREGPSLTLLCSCQGWTLTSPHPAHLCPFPSCNDAGWHTPMPWPGPTGPLAPGTFSLSWSRTQDHRGSEYSSTQCPTETCVKTAGHFLCLLWVLFHSICFFVCFWLFFFFFQTIALY